MRFRTWPVAALGLGGLLLLVAVSVLAASNRAQEIYSQLDQLNSHHREVENKLRRLRSDVHLSGIFMRDYLLDAERARAPEYRARLAEFRTNNVATVAELRELMRGRTDHDDRIAGLDAKLDEYWQAFDPLFDWSPTEKILLSAGFLKREVLPRREAVLGIASEIEELNNANHAVQRAEVTRQYAEFRSELHKLLWGSLILGLIVAVTAVSRLRVLEKRSDDERTVAEEAERQMRELSQQLVATQEEERKKLSRELHDHVGQMLTALRMELGRIDRLRQGMGVAADNRIVSAVAESRQLVDNMVRTVRDLALGLRPSMLDDLGLQPALEWHVRDFGRRYGVPVELDMEGDFDRLTEQHRICVYRAVQEALTNCIKHSRARRIDVRLTEDGDRLTVVVQDDGVGIDPARQASGLGLRGIEERVRELRGTMTIRSGKGAGTTLTVKLPLPAREPEVLRARAAG
ncbi:MAG TPA: sensor histidine kinase [Vicinamibacterales bacterium]|nr:sensor histidine kinase [Vicinamibacterales bacterium]